MPRSESIPVADQEHAEVNPRRNALTADRGIVELPALAFDLPVELQSLEGLIEFFIKRMSRHRRQIADGDEHLSLRLRLAASHRHARPSVTDPVTLLYHYNMIL